ncbi:hemolysin III family protein [Pseudosulfitobacter sp. SM2401]|uniref:PAQR family membrane homeostasis protein TrhA n=1 Tax=Pseudosulfitobacter sp. SM2401 TaxID=3350098 RepID=UPI0036F2F4C6
MRYPTSNAETAADGVVHAISVSLALFGAVWLWRYPSMWQSPAMAWAVGVFIVIMVVALVTSAVYHMTPISPLRATLRRCDHGLIFLRIASTYTPLVLIINTNFAYVVLAGVWVIALIGTVQKLFFWQADGTSSIAMYAVLSWAAVLLIWPMWVHLPHDGVGFVAVGGVLYSVGAVIYSRKTMPYRYPVWHVFATSASVAFYIAIVICIAA